MKTIINQLLSCIENTYKKLFIGNLKIEELFPYGYAVTLSNITINLLIENKEELLKVFKEELRKCKLNDSLFFHSELIAEGTVLSIPNASITYIKHNYEKSLDDITICKFQLR